MLVLLLCACATPRPETQELETLINILIVDQSESFDYAHLSSSDLAQLISHDAQAYTTWIAMVSVLEAKSIEQPLLLEGPFLLDTLLESNYSIYQHPKVQRYNQEKKGHFEQKLKSALEAYNKLITIKNRPYSDVNGALRYAERLANQQRFAEAKIRVIILSDLIHDLPDESKLAVFHFPSRATIYPVSFNQIIDLNKVFPANLVEPLVSFRADFFTYTY